nr:hypothetical protein [Aminithiophilus ramosus]
MFGYDPSAQHPFSIVKDQRLTRCDWLRTVKVRDGEAPVIDMVHPDPTRLGPVTVLRLKDLARRRSAVPAGEKGVNGADKKIFFSSDDDTPAFGVDLDDIPRAAGKTETFSLADGVETDTVMAPHMTSLSIDDGPGDGPEKRFPPRRRKEAEVVALGDIVKKVAETTAGLLQYLRLRRHAQRKDQARKQRRVKAIKHITLIFSSIDGTEKAVPLLPQDNPNIMPRGNPIVSIRRDIEKGREFHPLVAANAGIGCLSLTVGGQKGIDNFSTEKIAEISFDQRQPQMAT